LGEVRCAKRATQTGLGQQHFTVPRLFSAAQPGFARWDLWQPKWSPPDRSQGGDETGRQDHYCRLRTGSGRLAAPQGIEEERVLVRITARLRQDRLHVVENDLHGRFSLTALDGTLHGVTSLIRFWGCWSILFPSEISTRCWAGSVTPSGYDTAGVVACPRVREARLATKRATAKLTGRGPRRRRRKRTRRPTEGHGANMENLRMAKVGSGAGDC
jgi:hypothetical protein